MMDNPTLSETQIAVAIVEQDGAFLIGQRPAGVPLEGLWEFPGGKVEADESPAEAAIRECREETGLEIRVVRAFHCQLQQYAQDQVRLHFFLCRPVQSATPPRTPYRWVRRADLSRYEFPAGNRVVLHKLTSD